AFREVESAMFCKHLLNSFRDELAIVGVDELHILFYRWGLAARIKAMNPEQLWRPVVKSSSVEAPATHVSKPLSFREVEFYLFTIFNVEIDPDPIQESSIRNGSGVERRGSGNANMHRSSRKTFDQIDFTD